MENAVVTTVRLQKGLLEEIDQFAREEESDRTTIMKQALTKGLSGLKLEYALGQYLNDRASALKAAKIAGISLWEFIDVLRARGLSFRTDEEEIRSQLRELK